jgi:hypothetical protein
MVVSSQDLPRQHNPQPNVPYPLPYKIGKERNINNTSKIGSSGNVKSLAGISKTYEYSTIQP